MKTARLNHHLVPFFGDLPVSKIGSFDIELYKRQRQQEAAIVMPRGKTIKRAPEKITAAKPGTINRELAVLSHLFNKAIEWGWIDRRPAKLNRFQEGQGRISYLTAEQVGRLVECAKTDASPIIYPFIVIGVETSMRKMEILSIRREHVNVQHRTIFIPKAKAGAREQPITRHLADFLADYLAALQPGSLWLFPSPGAASGHAMDIRKAFMRVVEAAGLDPTQVVRHTLRHTAITHLVQAGVDLPTVKRISGHKTLAMVERYAHQNGAHIEGAMDRLQSRLKFAS
jgi:integrase